MLLTRSTPTSIMDLQAALMDINYGEFAHFEKQVKQHRVKLLFTERSPTTDGDERTDWGVVKGRDSLVRLG